MSSELTKTILDTGSVQKNKTFKPIFMHDTQVT